MTLSSGVTGYTTIHAGTARQALTRLRFVCQLADTARDLPMPALNALVSDAVDLVVHLERGPSGVKVTEILAVEDLAGGPDGVQFTAASVFARARRDADAVWTGEVPVRLGHRLADHGHDVAQLLGQPTTSGAGAGS